MKRKAATKQVTNDVKARVERESKDLSSAEIEYRLTLHRGTLADLEGGIESGMQLLAERRKAAGHARQSIAALEGLLAARR